MTVTDTGPAGGVASPADTTSPADAPRILDGGVPAPSRRHWIDDWRPEDPAFWASTGETIARRKIIDDGVEALAQAVIVALNQLEHVARQRHRRRARAPLEIGARRAEIDDQLIAQHETDRRRAADLESADGERLGGLGLRRAPPRHGGRGRGRKSQGGDE